MDKRALIALSVIVSALMFVLIAFNIMATENVVTQEHSVTKQTEHIENISDKAMVLDGWVCVDNLSVKSNPSKSSKTIGNLEFNKKIEYEGFDKKWFKIKYNGEDAYVNSKYIIDEDTGYNSYEQYILDAVAGYIKFSLPENSGFKSFMDYRAITSTGSDQYKLQTLYAETGSNGIRMVNGRYCVAVGSHFTSDIGQYFDLILANGTVIPCVLSDQKADVHTDSGNIVTEHNGCVSEFVVDTGYLNSAVKQRGNISYAKEGWDSPVAELKLYNKNVFDE